MKLLKKAFNVINSMNALVGKLVAWLIVFLTLIVVFEVITRRFFGAPTVWTFEIINMLFGAYFLLPAAAALLYGSHVSIDVAYKLLNNRQKAIIDVISYIIFYFPFCIILFWQGIIFAGTSWQIRETSQSVFAPPLYPIKTVIPVAAGLLILQGLVIFIQRLYFAIKGKELK